MRAGIDEEGWKRLCEELDAKIAKGRNFLKFGNYADAISELEDVAVTYSTGYSRG